MWNCIRDEYLNDCLVLYIEIDTFILTKKIKRYTLIVFYFWSSRLMTKNTPLKWISEESGTRTMSLVYHNAPINWGRENFIFLLAWKWEII